MRVCVSYTLNSATLLFLVLDLLRKKGNKIYIYVVNE